MSFFFCFSLTFFLALNVDWESVVLHLLLELLVPLVGANGTGHVLEVVAVHVALAPDLQAALIVDVVDEAVLGLVLVGESRVELGSPQSLGLEVLAQTLGNARWENLLPSVHDSVVLSAEFRFLGNRQVFIVQLAVQSLGDIGTQAFIVSSELGLLGQVLQGATTTSAIFCCG